jgi:hypothetical protein
MNRLTQAEGWTSVYSLRAQVHDLLALGIIHLCRHGKLDQAENVMQAVSEHINESNTTVQNAAASVCGLLKKVDPLLVVDCGSIPGWVERRNEIVCISLGLAQTN